MDRTDALNTGDAVFPNPKDPTESIDRRHFLAVAGAPQR